VNQKAKFRVKNRVGCATRTLIPHVVRFFFQTKKISPREERVAAAGQECPQQQQQQQQQQKEEEATYCEILADLLKSRSQGLEQQEGKRDSLGFIYLFISVLSL
jgi:hypothetical protein